MKCTDSNEWTMPPAKRISFEGFKARMSYTGVNRLDVRFSFQKGGEVLLARNVRVADITEAQFGMIVAWRRTADPIPLFNGVHPLCDLGIKEFLQSGTPNRRAPRDAIKGHKPIVESKYPHYFKDVRHLEYVDVYRVLELFGVTDPAIGHAIKKLLVAGARGTKDRFKDIEEAIDTLTRHQVMRGEDK